MNSIEKTLEYHELLMVIDNLNNIQTNSTLPKCYTFSYFKDEKDIEDWVNIHISSGEFASITKGRKYFYDFYSEFLDELNKRCFFIEYNGNKIATATISPVDELGYSCVIDWLAISKEFQGKKLAKPLIYKCLEVAKELGYNKILLHTQTHTWLAAKLYLDLGFIPFKVENNLKGWQILKTITNHEKLKDIKAITQDEMYDNLVVNVVQELNKLHKNYNYSVWYKNNQNNVYVRENNIDYQYKFYDNGKTLKLIKKTL